MDRFVSHDVFICFYLLAFDAFLGRWELTNNWKIDFLTSVADPDLGSGIRSGAFLTPGSGIRDKFFPDPRSRIPDQSIYQRVKDILGKKYLNSLSIGSILFFCTFSKN